MNYSNFSTEDFISDEQFIDWVNSPNEISDAFWNEWLAKNPAQKDSVAEAKAFISSLAFETTSLSENEVQQMLHHIHEDIEETTSLVFSKKSKTIPMWRIAAAALVILLAGSFFFFGKSDTTYITQFNETQTLQLPDGSEVIMNANSKIQTAKNWDNETDREVWLEGEAYFSVTPTPKRGNRKFVVHAGELDVEVIGTKFNVNTRKEKTSVVLQSGKIQLTSSNTSNNNILEVSPNEKVEITPTTPLQKTTVNTAIYTSWTKQKLVFENTPLSHLVEILENNYGYQVKIKDTQLLNKELSGTFPTNNPKGLLKSVATMFQLEIEQKDKTIFIK